MTDWATWHHPRYVGQQDVGTGVVFGFREFTGDEPEPVVPETAVAALRGTPELRRIEQEVRLARRLWLAAQRQRAVAEILTAAAGDIAAFLAARGKLLDAFDRLIDVQDTGWHAALLDLVTARTAATAAAAVLDAHGAKLDDLGVLPESVWDVCQTDAEIARDLGIDLGPLDLTAGGASCGIEHIIGEQNQRLRKVEHYSRDIVTRV